MLLSLLPNDVANCWERRPPHQALSAITEAIKLSRSDDDMRGSAESWDFDHSRGMSWVASLLIRSVLLASSAHGKPVGNESCLHRLQSVRVASCSWILDLPGRWNTSSWPWTFGWHHWLLWILRTGLSCPWWPLVRVAVIWNCDSEDKSKVRIYRPTICLRCLKAECPTISSFNPLFSSEKSRIHGSSPISLSIISPSWVAVVKILLDDQPGWDRIDLDHFRIINALVTSCYIGSHWLKTRYVA